MRTNRNRMALWFMILGFGFLALGMSTNNTVFTYAAIAFAVIAIVLNWQRRRR